MAPHATTQPDLPAPRRPSRWPATAAADRAQPPGVTVWFTGLPCAGKTTVANPLAEQLEDRAGVGSWYGTYDAQAAFDANPAGELGVVPPKFEHAFWCRPCGGMATTRTCPHPGDARVALSGTAVRAMLGRGELPPPEFTRPEVARLLAAGYRAPEGST